MEAATARPAGRRRRAPLGKAAILLVVAAFLGLLAYGLAQKAPADAIDDALARGEPAPAPALELPVLTRGEPGPALAGDVRRAALDGVISLPELRGTPLVLNFWASWCPPCREEAPLLERTWRLERRKGVLFLGLDQQDLSGDARAFVEELGLSYPTIRDESDDVGRAWGVTGLPETFFLSARGEVVGHVIGAVSEEHLRAGIAAARSGRPLDPLSGGDRRPTR